MTNSTLNGMVIIIHLIVRQNFDRKIEDIDKKILNTNGLVKKTDYHKKTRN